MRDGPDEASFDGVQSDTRGDGAVDANALPASDSARHHAALRRLEATDRRRLAARLDSTIQEHGFVLRYAPILSAGAEAPGGIAGGRYAANALNESLPGGAPEAREQFGRHLARGASVNRREPDGQAMLALFRGAELVIGVQHRRRGVVPVESYLRSVKRAPLIASVIAEGLTEALAETANWSPAWSLSVVVPPHRADLIALRQALSRLDHGQACRVALMLDEAALIVGGLDAIDMLDALRSDGFGLILDKFGGRFGSLALLRSLPLTGVKLDRGLLHGDPSDRQLHRALAQASIVIGHDLGLTIIASGVETETEYTLMQRLGIDAVQGSWASGPVPIAAINHLIRGASHAA